MTTEINIHSPILKASAIAPLIDVSQQHIRNIIAGRIAGEPTIEKIKKAVINELFPKTHSSKITKSKTKTIAKKHK